MEQKSLIEFFLDSNRWKGVGEPLWKIESASERPSGRVVVPEKCELVEAIFNFEVALDALHTFDVVVNEGAPPGVISVPNGTVGGHVAKPDPRVYLDAGDSIYLFSNLETSAVDSITHLVLAFRKM